MLHFTYIACLVTDYLLFYQVSKYDLQISISRKILFRMRNISNKSCIENQNTHLLFSNLFPKIVSFMRQCRKIWWSQRGHKLQYEMTHTRCMLDKQGYTHACTCTRTNAHRHTQKYVILTAFQWQQYFVNAPQC